MNLAAVERLEAALDATGYGDAALAYLDAGWSSPLPLPPKRKHAVPEGFTGHEGKIPSREQIAEWRREFPDGNLGLRLPDGWIGIDVDAYKAEGARSFDDLVARCGPLPATWRST